MNEQIDLTLSDNGATLESVEEYQFKPPRRPIRGYPELWWAGKRPFTSTRYYPAQLKETHGEAVDGERADGTPIKGWRNKLYWGDNLQVMSHLLKEFRGQVDLVYIDPPFDSKTEYKSKIKLRGNEASSDMSAFEEKQYSDVWAGDEFLQFIYERLVILRDLLTPSGSLLLHCDWHKSHHFRSILDQVFGPNCFRNEIIWFYRRWPTKTYNFQSMHDTLFWYTKNVDNSHTFNVQYELASERTLSDYGGKRLITVETEDGNFVKRQTEEESQGVPMRDVWTINRVHPRSHEHTKYPTQKPLDLLNLIVRTASNPGDLVLDSFCGSGTTLLSAMQLGRRFIGADINLGAIQTTTQRLVQLVRSLREGQGSLDLDHPGDQTGTYFTGFEVYNVNHYDVFRNPAQAKDLLLEALEVQPIESSALYDGEKDGRMVKVMPVNRIATKQDLNDLLTGFDLKTFEKRKQVQPNRPVEKVTLVCMGHDPDLKPTLVKAVKEMGYTIDVEVVDILRDRQDLQFKREAEAAVRVEGGKLVIEAFYPMNLLQKLSLMKENVEDWRELVESVMIDWNYDGAVLTPQVVDVPEGDGLVKGSYRLPDDAGTIRVKITDLLSESLEVEVQHG